jgi:hypothetical protein
VVCLGFAFSVLSLDSDAGYGVSLDSPSRTLYMIRYCIAERKDEGYKIKLLSVGETHDSHLIDVECR